MQTRRELPVLPKISPIDNITYEIQSNWPDSVKNNAKDFQLDVNNQLINLNKRIHEYNKSFNSPQSSNGHKIELLQQIYEERKKLGYKYPPVLLGYCSDYQDKIQSNLYNQLKNEFSALGIDSIREDVIYQRPSLQPSDALADFISNMPLDKAAGMLKILSKMSSTYDSKISLEQLKKSLIDLYKPLEDGYTQSKAFWEKNDIQFLAGFNSMNFKVTHKDTGHVSLLVAQEQLGMPKNTLSDVRPFLKDVFLPVRAEQQAVFKNEKGLPITKSLMVTDFCPGGDLMQYSAKLNHSDSIKTTSALNLYSQMTHVLITLGEKNAFHSDMKNKNWIVDKNEQIRIVDTKGICPTERGLYNVNNDANRWYLNGVHSDHMDAPERGLRFTDGFSADKAHSYMLGKNLYQFLTECSNDSLEKKHDASEYDFDLPIFKTQTGIELKNLIQQMIKPAPHERIALADALLALQLITLKDECNNCLDVIVKNQSFGKVDYKMNEFSEKQSNIIHATTDVNQLIELKATLNRIAHDPIINAIHKKVDAYNQSNLYIKGHAKAANITKAMAEIPIDERHNVLNENATGLFADVQKALATPRFIGNMSSTTFKDKWLSLKERQQTSVATIDDAMKPNR